MNEKNCFEGQFQQQKTIPFHLLQRYNVKNKKNENVESTVQNLKFYYTLEERTLRHITLQMVSVLIVAYDNLFWPETFFDFRAGTKINLKCVEFY